ncbi:hypothetical protein [Flexibacterium corallicola]|uniref:hypothetical protein n=1 Tax=Flexibacterium corallicola TaxID=3037259 RepID=UPI00286F064B|nr:hypothetical protein [Pseudovibrio sp. M1P-2-3]
MGSKPDPQDRLDDFKRFLDEGEGPRRKSSAKTIFYIILLSVFAAVIIVFSLRPLIIGY